MHIKNSLRWAVGMVLTLSLQWPAAAGVLLGGTRVILQEKDRETSIPVKNTGNEPYVVQAWIDAGEGKNKTPLVVTPPLSRLDPGMENILRIMRVGGGLPGDRESVFWLNVKEIPQKPAEENVLQIAVRTRVKLFYRPAGLPGNAAEARSQLEWTVTSGEGGRGAVLKLANPTPWHVTLTSLNINSGQQIVNANMLAPFGESTYALKDLKAPQAIDVRFSTLNDYGAETPEESVKVPVGTNPVALRAQLVAPQAGAERR